MIKISMLFSGYPKQKIQRKSMFDRPEFALSFIRVLHSK